MGKNNNEKYVTQVYTYIRLDYLQFKGNVLPPVSPIKTYRFKEACRHLEVLDSKLQGKKAKIP